MDIYKYTILSHPDPSLIGRETVIALPREPATIMAEKGFFNELVLSFKKIDTSILAHTIGNRRIDKTDRSWCHGRILRWYKLREQPYRCKRKHYHLLRNGRKPLQTSLQTNSTASGCSPTSARETRGNGSM